MDVLFGCIKGRRRQSYRGDGEWLDEESWQELTLGGASSREEGFSRRETSSSDSFSKKDRNGHRRSPPPPPTLRERQSSSTSSSRCEKTNRHRAPSRSSGENSNRLGLESSTESSTTARSKVSSTTSARPDGFAAPFTPPPAVSKVAGTPAEDSIPLPPSTSTPPVAIPTTTTTLFECLETPPATPRGNTYGSSQFVASTKFPFPPTPSDADVIRFEAKKNSANSAMLSPPTPIPSSAPGVSSSNRNVAAQQPNVEWLNYNFTTFANDQMMSTTCSSPQLHGTHRNHIVRSPTIKILNRDNGGGSSMGPPILNMAPQLQQQQQQQRSNRSNNLHVIVGRYKEMNRKRLEQHRLTQQQQQKQHLHRQKQQQKQLQQQQLQLHKKQQLYHQRGDAGESASKYVVDQFQGLSLESGFGVVRSDEEAFADFQFLAVLGKGNFGKVILARDERNQNRLVAVKVLKKKEIIKKREVVHTMTEVSVLKTFFHPFLVECFRAFQTTTRLCIVLEYVRGGELYYQLFKKRRFSESQTRFYVAEIVLAVGYLHSNNFIYRDLKLENLLLDAAGHVKITDFGLCKDLQAWNEQLFGGVTRETTSSIRRRNNNVRKDMTFCGTPEYLAPEMLHVPGQFNGVSRINGGGCSLIYGKGVDWWALGIILYEMLLGKLPFRTKTGDYDQLFHSICHRDISFPDHLNDDVRNLLDGLLQKNPHVRLGRSNGNGRDYLDICETRWFDGVDWEDVYEKRVPPPFVPRVDDEEDTQHFSREFLELPTELTPTSSYNADNATTTLAGETTAPSSHHHDPFRGFSFCRS